MSFHGRLNQLTTRRLATVDVARGTPVPRGVSDCGMARRKAALVQDLGVRSLARIVWHAVMRRREVSVFLSGQPGWIGPLRRGILSLAEAVVVPPELVGTAALKGLPARIAVIGQVSGRSPFMGCTPVRSDVDTYRIVYVGELAPDSGVAEFLSCAIAWADANPHIPVEITWLGRGDLLGVLRAQPLPPNLCQVFGDISPPCELASRFERCGLLVVPSLEQARAPLPPDAPFLLEAMAAGLLVLGSVRSPRVRAFVIQDETGWLFDPRTPGAMYAALDRALRTAPERLNAMRLVARGEIAALWSGRDGAGPADRLAGLMGSGAAVQA